MKISTAIAVVGLLLTAGGMLSGAVWEVSSLHSVNASVQADVQAYRSETNQRLDKMEQKIDKIDQRLQQTERVVEHVSTVVDRLDRKLEQP